MLSLGLGFDKDLAKFLDSPIKQARDGLHAPPHLPADLSAGMAVEMVKADRLLLRGGQRGQRFRQARQLFLAHQPFTGSRRGVFRVLQSDLRPDFSDFLKNVVFQDSAQPAPELGLRVPVELAYTFDRSRYRFLGRVFRSEPRPAYVWQ